MTSYAGEHAELYDLFYAAKPYAEEALWVHRALERFGGGAHRILELACGTGKHARELEKLGHDVVATDYSPDILAVARRRGEREHSHVRFDLQDMTKLNVAGAPFDGVVCLFDSIGYVQTNDNIRRVMAGVADHLIPGGLFVVEFWHAAAMIAGFDPVRVRRFAAGEDEIVRISETRLHHAEQVAEVTYTIHRLNADGRYQTLRETQRNRYFLPQEFRSLAESAGLQVRGMYDGFSESTEISDRTWHILAVVQRPDRP